MAKNRRSGNRPARPPTGASPSRAPSPTGAPGAEPVRRSPGKRLVFHLVTVTLFFGALELGLGLAGVEPVTVASDPYVGFSASLPLFQPVGDSLRTAPNKLAFFNRQSFLREKAKGVSRIFTLGGSCTYGRPFDDATSFSGWLRGYLEALAPGRWEVVNAGGISYASYRVSTLMEELVRYDPDLFVIYTGHNEFLERRTYSGLIAEPEVLTSTKLLLQRSRLWTLGRTVADRRQRHAQRAYEMTGEVEELLDNSAGLDYYHRDGHFADQVLAHYRYNLHRMVQLARAHGAGVIFVTVPVNEKDFSPFKSQHGDGVGELGRARVRELLSASSAALEEGRAAAARDLAAEAVDLDPRYADAHFLLGRAVAALDRHDEAGRSFAAAIEEDVCPLRALERTNEAIVDTTRVEQVPLVDFRELLRQIMAERYGHRNLGDELFLDHAHPTPEAHGLLARALVDEMSTLGLVGAGPTWHAERGEPVDREVLARVDATAQAEAYKNLSKVLLWAGKEREAAKYTELAAASLGGDWEVHYNAGRLRLDAGEPTEAVASLRRAVELGPAVAAAHDLLGAALAADGDLDGAVEEGRRAVALDPGMASAWSNLGTAYAARGDLQAALDATRRAVELDGESAEAHNNLGKALFDLGRANEALASFDRAIALRPGHVEAMVNRGLVLGELGRFTEAEAAFAAVLTIEPELSAAHLGRARALLGAGQVAAAVAPLERVVSLDAGSLEAWSLLVTAESAAAPERAEATLGRALLAHPEAGGLHHLRGRLLARRGEFDAAVSAFEQAVRLEPSLLAARVDLGNLLAATQRPEEAVEAFRRASELAPDDGRIHHLLAVTLLMNGRPDEGQLHLERSLELAPGNALAAQDLATLYERAGRLGEARELYRRAVELDPNLGPARAGVERLATQGAAP